MSLFRIAVLTAGVFTSPVAATDRPPALAREFRGVWVATVSNIDWPSKPGLPTEVQKKELLAILDQAASLKLNAAIFQIRPMADALYPSQLEPWSGFLTGVPGQAPQPVWDPLAFAVEACHARGLELHAWFNPYRARHPSSKGTLPSDHVVNRLPDLATVYGTHHWLNPTHPEVQAHSLAVILDVVKRYDIDGIHIDDYFYPYKEKTADGQLLSFPDDDTWSHYKKTGGNLSRDDWRRAAVNTFVERMYNEIKALKPMVKVGISPFGIWRSGYPKGIVGFDQYSELYADAKLWLNRGWVDYFAPQLYWRIGAEKQSFPKLLAWWSSENSEGRHLWPGLYTSRVTGMDKGWPAAEIADQIAMCRKHKGTAGAIHFSAKALLSNPGGVADAIREVYAEPALVPASPWLARGAGPAPPTVALLPRTATIKTGNDARFVVLRANVGEAWTTTVRGVSPDGPTLVQVPTRAGRLVVSVVDRAGRESEMVEVIAK